MDLHRLAQRAATRAVTRSFSRVQTHPARLARLKSTGSNTGREPEEAPNGFDKSEPIKYENRQETWKESFLTPYMFKYPVLQKTAQTIYNGLGLYSKQNDAIRNSKYWYMGCAERDIIERDFLYKECQIPQTFHSWFQITNLHVWLLTVRFRALPKPHGRFFLQSLVDFFFQDIEDRLRALLGPRTSERTIQGYLKEYRELYNGSLIALDVGLVGGDWELSGAVWRNLFDARGWDLAGKRDDEGNFIPPGSYVPTSASTGRKDDTLATDGSFYASSQANYRELAAEEQKRLALADPGLAQMPYRIYLFTAFLRRDLKRLEDISDEDILAGEGFRDGFSLIARPGQDDVDAAGLSERELQMWRVQPLPWEIMEGEVAKP